MHTGASEAPSLTHLIVDRENITNVPLNVRKYLLLDHHLYGRFVMKGNEAYKAYTSIANQLVNDPTVIAICQKLCEITSSAILIPILMQSSTTTYVEADAFEVPFVFLEGSSGSGKTQMAHNIISRLCLDIINGAPNTMKRRCIYVPFLVPDKFSQRIYDNYFSVSRIFNDCIDQDLLQYEISRSLVCGTVFYQELFLFGFIFAAIFEVGGEDKTIKPMKGQYVLERIRSDPVLKDSRPVFLLDECVLLSETPSNKHHIRYIRNCFRSLGLGLVMMGTDSRAAELPYTTGKSSRGDETSRAWCHIFGEYPRFRATTLPERYQHVDWYQLVLSNSRPWFSKLLNEAAIRFSTASFEGLLRIVFEKVVRAKQIFQTSYGKLGQVRLFQNAHTAASQDSWISTLR